jgi:hypothetical protein
MRRNIHRHTAAAESLGELPSGIPRDGSWSQACALFEPTADLREVDWRLRADRNQDLIPACRNAEGPIDKARGLQNSSCALCVGPWDRHDPQSRDDDVSRTSPFAPTPI